MNRSFQPAYNELLSEPDNVEIIRDQIAALLVLDLQNQYELAVQEDASDADDYKMAVYLEDTDPLQWLDEDDESCPFPLVNILLDGADPDKGTASVNKQANIARFFLDVYAGGNDAEGDYSKAAALKVWKAARLVRRILRAEPNTYLRLRGVVGSVSFKFQAYDPNRPQSAIRVKIVRITLEVSYVEDVAITQGVIDWEINGIITDENGHVLVGEGEKNE